MSTVMMFCAAAACAGSLLQRLQRWALARVRGSAATTQRHMLCASPSRCILLPLPRWRSCSNRSRSGCPHPSTRAYRSSCHTHPAARSIKPSASVSPAAPRHEAGYCFRTPPTHAHNLPSSRRGSAAATECSALAMLAAELTPFKCPNSSRWVSTACCASCPVACLEKHGMPCVMYCAESDPAPTWPYDQQQQQQASTAWPQLEPTPYQQQAAQPLQQQAPLPGQQQYAAYTSYAAAPALPAQQPYAPPQPAGMPPMYNQGPPAAACSTAAGGGGSDDPPGAAPPSTYSPPPADASQQQPQGYMPDGSAYIASAYPPLPVVPYSQGARNMAAVSGVLALPPNMTVNNGR
jgi:hypothetical protein